MSVLGLLWLAKALSTGLFLVAIRVRFLFLNLVWHLFNFVSLYQFETVGKVTLGLKGLTENVFWGVSFDPGCDFWSKWKFRLHYVCYVHRQDLVHNAFSSREIMHFPWTWAFVDSAICLTLFFFCDTVKFSLLALCYLIITIELCAFIQVLWLMSFKGHSALGRPNWHLFFLVRSYLIDFNLYDCCVPGQGQAVSTFRR